MESDIILSTLSCFHENFPFCSTAHNCSDIQSLPRFIPMVWITLFERLDQGNKWRQVGWSCWLDIVLAIILPSPTLTSLPRASEFGSEDDSGPVLLVYFSYMYHYLEILPDLI